MMIPRRRKILLRSSSMTLLSLSRRVPLSSTSVGRVMKDGTVVVLLRGNAFYITDQKNDRDPTFRFLPVFNQVFAFFKLVVALPAALGVAPPVYALLPLCFAYSGVVALNCFLGR